MSSGPDNYVAAEQRIDDALAVHTNENDIELAALLMAEAQVRATLAVAAAFARPHMGRDAAGDWNAVAR